MATVRQTARNLRHVFLRDPSVPIAWKGLVILSLILSRGLHLAGTWSDLTPREFRSLTRAIVDTVRLLAEQARKHHNLDEVRKLSDDDVLATLGVLFPARLITVMKLNTAIRIVELAAPQLLTLLWAASEANGSWFRAFAERL